jgi:hypothetical protein
MMGMVTAIPAMMGIVMTTMKRCNPKIPMGMVSPAIVTMTAMTQILVFDPTAWN